MLTPPHHQILHTVHDKDYFVLLSLPNSFIICCDSPSRFCIGGAFKMSRSCWIIATRLLKHPRYCCLSAFDTTFRVWGCKNKHPVKMAIQCLLTTDPIEQKGWYLVDFLLTKNGKDGDISDTYLVVKRNTLAQSLFSMFIIKLKWRYSSQLRYQG